MDFKNIIYNRISIIALSLLFSVAMVFTFASESYIKYRTIEDDIVSKEEELLKKNQLIEIVKNYNEVNKDLKVEEADKINNLPPTGNNTEIYIGIMEKNRLINISQYSFETSPIKTEGINSSKVNFLASGSFENFLNFIIILEKNLPIIEFEEISATRKQQEEKDAEFAPNPNLALKVNFRYYYR